MVDLVEHLEGRTRLLVPSVSLTQDPPPTAPVFFNPAASLNRDISVAITAASGGSTFCDSMAGVGARGVRVANEVPRLEKVTMVDFNAQALGAAKEAAAMNRIVQRCEFSNSETSSYLHSRYGRNERFDYVDIDPFGTPVRQLQAGLCSTSDGGILSVTATDTAVLCGVYPRVSERRYGSTSLSSSFRHETGIRILAGALARLGAALDLGVEPVFAHATRHYIRLFARVETGASRADGSLACLGYVSWCPRCGHVETSEVGQNVCPNCGKRAKPAGPLWLQGLTTPELLGRASKAGGEMGLGPAAETIETFDGVGAYPPWSFSIEGASSTLKVATVPESAVCQALAENGWGAMRTPFEKTGVKTDAPHEEFLVAVERSVARVKAGQRR